MTRVLHINSLDYGGAAIAARRLHRGLLREGCDSRMLIQEAGATPPTEHAEFLDQEMYPPLTDPVLDRVLDLVYRTRCAPGAGALFSTDQPTRDLSTHPLVLWADVINFHWVARMVSARAMASIQSLGKPVVWTLHDQFPFSGGCHYSGSCEGYQTDCGACPLLPPAVQMIPRLVLEQKLRWIDPRRLTVVSPSQWLASAAQRSTLFKSARTRVIANSVPVEDFQRQSREAARELLGLPRDATIILFGADDLGDVRKGQAHLSDAFELLASHPILGPRMASGAVICVSFGKGGSKAESTPVRQLGELSGSRLCAAYRAADVFVLPTLDDNFPNTMLEAVSAGTPVVAYATGGVADFVKDAGCGVLVQRGDVTALSAALADIALDDARRECLRPLCENYARKHLTLTSQARAYAGLYDELLHETQLPSGLPADSSSDVAVPDTATLLEIISGQSSEVQDLRSEAARNREESRRAHDGWRIARETLHAVHDEWRTTRETLYDVQQRFQTIIAQAAAERSVLRARARRLMKRVAIFGTGDLGLRAWEALARRGTVDIVGFVDDQATSADRTFLGGIVHPLSWLGTTDLDIVAVASLHPEHCLRQLAEMNVAAVVLPMTDGDEALGSFVTRRFPDPLLAMLASPPPAPTVRVGIFGTGSAAMKVWEALAEIDRAETAWFADNNAAQQGRILLWVDVIAPAEIVAREVDVVVIGSISRQPIRDQLVALGVDTERIIMPDVQGTVDQIRDQLELRLNDRVCEVVAG